jgi:hypothetical protein
MFGGPTSNAIWFGDTPAAQSLGEWTTGSPATLLAVVLIQLVFFLTFLFTIVAMTRTWDTTGRLSAVLAVLLYVWIVGSEAFDSPALATVSARAFAEYVYSAPFTDLFPIYLLVSVVATVAIPLTTSLIRNRPWRGRTANWLLLGTIALALGCNLLVSLTTDRTAAPSVFNAFLYGTGSPSLLVYLLAIATYVLVPGLLVIASSSAVIPMRWSYLLRVRSMVHLWLRFFLRDLRWLAVYALALCLCASAAQIVASDQSLAVGSALEGAVITFLQMGVIAGIVWLAVLVRGRDVDAICALLVMVVLFSPPALGAVPGFREAVPMASGHVDNTFATILGSVAAIGIVATACVIGSRLARRTWIGE